MVEIGQRRALQGGALWQEARVLGLIGAGHFLAHFYIIVLPPLFPLLHDTLGVSFAPLGLLMTTVNLVTSVAQIPVGFIVDRFGARLLLAVGLLLIGGSLTLAGIIGTYTALLLGSAALGLGNSVFHPADYAVLARQVDHGRLGRAFSIHTALGHVGWAAAPVVIGLMTLAWGWQTALMLAGVPGIVLAVAVLLSGRVLEASPAAPTPGATRPGVDLLLSRPMLALFLFMALAAMSNSGLNNFSVSVLVDGGSATLAEANTVLTAFFVASALGILIGGVIADRVRRHEQVMVAGFVAGAAALVVLGSTALPVAAITGIFLLVGLVQGAIRPSRDMMVQRIAPEGATGAVFGFVTVGLNVGGALAPVLFGWLIDQGAPEWVYYGAAACMLLALPCGFAGRPGARAA